MKPLQSVYISVLLALVISGGCQTYESADLVGYTVQQGFQVSTDAPPTDSMQVGIVSMQEDGFYLFGLVPVIPVSLKGCLDRMVAEAKTVGADGLADVRYEFNPASLFKFVTYGLPDWTATVRVTGTAYKNLPSRYRPRPRGRQIGPIHTEPEPDPEPAPAPVKK